jgi:hypothetical protein
MLIVISAIGTIFLTAQTSFALDDSVNVKIKGSENQGSMEFDTPEGKVKVNVEAQETEDIDTPKGEIKIEIKGGPQKPSETKQSYEEKEETNDYIIIRKKEGRTLIKVLEPEEATAEIYSENSTKPIHKAEIPTSYNYLTPGFYKIIVYNDNGKWQKKIEIKRGYETILYVKSLKPIEKPKEEVKKPMTSSSFRELINNLKNEPFSSGKLNILKDAVRGNYFTSEQVVDILSVFDFEKDKLESAKMLYPKVVDKNNFFKVYSVFKFNSDKEELRKWIDDFESGKISTDKEEGW